MSFKVIRELPSPKEIVELVPVPEEAKRIKAQRDQELKDIMEGKDHRFLLMIGPCSADDEEAVCDYVSRLAKVQEKVKEEILIVPRIYTNKPRTTGEGYKGMLHQPNPDEAPNMLDGILAIRRMHIRAIMESGLTAADEMLYTDNLAFCEDLLSYIAVGARSVENQQHRLAASGINVPVGMKNPPSGDLTVMLHAVKAAQVSHTFIHNGSEVETTGNSYAHAIMRGSINKHGESIPNYHYEDLIFASEMYMNRKLANPLIVVDTNHANSRKCYAEQPRIAKEVLHTRKYSDLVRKLVRGLLIESYIEPGNQEIAENRVYGKSITDACIGWAESEALIYYIAEHA